MTVETMGTEAATAGDGVEELPTVEESVEAPETGESAGAEEEPETFPRAYVQELREEAAANRVRAARADALEARLRETAVVAATKDLLHSPEDLPWSPSLEDADGFPDPAKIRDAANRLIVEKPYLARVHGEVGQGQRGDVGAGVSLAGMLQQRA